MQNRHSSGPARALLAAAFTSCAFIPVSLAQAGGDGSVIDLAEDALVKRMGLADCTVISLEVANVNVGEVFTINLAIGEEQAVVDFVPHNIRRPGYELVEDRGDDLVAVDPGVARTVRGMIRSESDAVVRGSLLDDGLHCVLRMPDGAIHWIEPVAAHVDGFSEELHVFYNNDAIPPSGGTCGTPSPVVGPIAPEPEAPSSFLGGVFCAELACDTDYEYYQSYGSSSSSVQNRIELIINTSNAQYESQTEIRHELTQILVRTSPSDPYTSNNYDTLLCQFITEWTNNQSVSRDVAHLFTGRGLNGSVIGVAADIGDICDNNGGCSGQIFMDGAYCLAESDCCGSLGCATDLTAHELGHLWGGNHCSCTGNTMNSYLTCTNNFSSGTINDIIAHRNSRNCLDDCEGGGGGDDGYCAAACTNTDYEYIASVVVSGAGISNSSGASGYSDYTAIVGSVERGGSYPIEVIIGNNDWPSDIGGLWIDWNADEDFDDSGETITTSWSGAGPYNVTINVPSGAALGETRMRTRIHDGDYDSLAACGNATYGEVEDYTLDISEKVPEDCLGDISGDGQIDGADLGYLIGAWGPCSGSCPADFNNDGVVDGSDLGQLIGAWGLCP